MAMPRPEPEPHVHEHVHDEIAPIATAARREMVSVPFGLAQMCMLAIGIFFVVLGAIALARTGLDAWTTEQILIGPFSMTPLLAAGILVAGLLAIASAAGRGAARGMSMFLGPLLVAGGIILVIQNIAQLGTNRADAILFIVSGVVALFGAIATPTVTVAEERSVVQT